MMPPTEESEYIALEKWRNFLRAPYFEGQGKSSRLHPFNQISPPVGTWRLDDLRGLHGREISVLVEIDSNEIIDSELDLAKQLLPDRRIDGERYAQWIREGSRPPPRQFRLRTDSGSILWTTISKQPFFGITVGLLKK